jgi:O-antigen/teichoic acid export membrane protein
MLKEVVRHSTFTTVGSLANAVIGLLFAGLTIRFLGNQRAGFLLILQSVVGISTTMGGLGLGTAAIRRIAVLEGQGKLSEVRTCLGVVLCVNLFVGLIVAALVPFVFPWIFRWSKTDVVFRPDAFYACVLLALTFLVQQISSAYAIVFPGMRRYDLVAVLGTVSGLLAGGGGLLVLSINRTMTALAALSLTLSVLLLAINIILVKRLMQAIIIPAWNLSELRSMLRFGGWVYLEQIASLLGGTLDKFLLTNFLGSAVLPYYVIGQRAVSQVHTLLTSQSQYLFPMLAARGDQMSSDLERVEDRLRWFVGFISATIYGGLTIIAYPLLAMLVREAFAKQAFLPFVLACLQGFFLAHIIVPYFVTYAEGHPAPNAIMVPVNGVLVFVTMLLLIPKLGVLGASLAQLWIGPIGLMLIGWILLSGRRFSWKRMFRPLASPVATWLLLLGVAWATWSLQLGGSLIFWLLAVGGGFISVLVGLLIERRFFGKFKCFETLVAAVNLLVHRFIPLRGVD